MPDITLPSGVGRRLTVSEMETNLTNLNTGITNISASTGSSQVGWTAPGGSTRTLAAKLGESLSVLDYGADPTGVANSTAAFTAAKAALSTAKGTIHVPPGIYAVNLVIDQSWSGITIHGQGTSESKLAPTSGYLKPYSTSSAVIQVGDGTANAVAGFHLKDVCIYGGNTGQYGLAFYGGAYRNFATNIQILNFTKRCLQFRCVAGVSACTYNKVNGLTVATSVLGADGIYFEDTGTDNTAYTTANDIVNFDVTADGGYQLRSNSAGGNMLVNGYIQQSYSALGILLEKGYTRSPQIYTTNVIADNAVGATAVNMILDYGVDWQNVAAYTVSPIVGQLVNTGYTFNSNAKPNGTISASSTSLSVSSATGVAAGRTVVVPGAGVSGRPLVAKVTSISGTTATLDTAASTSVTATPMYVGDNLTDMPFLQDRVSWLSANGVNLSASRLNDLLPPGAKGALYKGSGLRSFEPLNNTGPMWDLGGTVHYYLQDDGGNYTVSSITQSGTTVTVNTSGSHNGAVGDVIQISGVNEAGINGSWKLETRPSNTSMTFTSTVSQTLAGVTGSPALKVNKISQWRYGNLEVGRALRLRKSDGTWADVLFSSNTNSQVNFQTPDTSAGSLVMTMGSTATTSARFVLQASAGGLYMNGYGAVGVGGNNGDTSLSLYLIKRAAGTPATNAAGGTIFVDSTGALKYVSPGGTATQLAPN